MKEGHLLVGKLQPISEHYVIPKIAGINQSYKRPYGTQLVSVVPANFYGPNDNFEFESLHIPDVLVPKVVGAKRSRAPRVTISGRVDLSRKILQVEVWQMHSYYCGVTRCPNHEFGQWESGDGGGRSWIIERDVKLEGDICEGQLKPKAPPCRVLEVPTINVSAQKRRISLEEVTCYGLGRYETNRNTEP